MGLGVVLRADKPRSKIKVSTFECAKIPFHQRQILITIMDGLGGSLTRGEIGLHHVTAVQLGMSLERWSIEGEDQPLLVHGQF